jgi:hypothetical protein
LVGPRDCDGGRSPDFGVASGNNRPKGAWSLTMPRVRIAFQQQANRPAFRSIHVPEGLHSSLAVPGSEFKRHKGPEGSRRDGGPMKQTSRSFGVRRGGAIQAFSLLCCPCLNAASRAVGGQQATCLTRQGHRILILREQNLHSGVARGRHVSEESRKQLLDLDTCERHSRIVLPNATKCSRVEVAIGRKPKP